MSGGNHGWANPSPAGLVALGIACFTFFALLTGKVEHTALPLMGVWLLGGFIVQIVVGLIELKEGNIVGGNVFTFFAAFFMFVTGLNMIVKFWAASKGIALDARIDGWAWLVLAIALTFFWPCYLAGPKSMGLAVTAIVPAGWILCLMDLHIIGHEYALIAGWLILITGALGLYTGLAIAVNTRFQRAVLPVGSPILKEKSSHISAAG